MIHGQSTFINYIVTALGTVMISRYKHIDELLYI